MHLAKERRSVKCAHWSIRFITCSLPVARTADYVILNEEAQKSKAERFRFKCLIGS